MTSPDRESHPSVARVLAALTDAGLSPTVRHLPDAVRTAQAAADALGITPAEIANSLIFVGHRADGSTEPVLVMASGGHRVDPAKVAAATGHTKLSKADAEFVRTATGFAIGGVAPVGHLQPITTVVDTALAQFEEIWAAAGHSHSVFAMTYPDLLRITDGTALEVA